MSANSLEDWADAAEFAAECNEDTGLDSETNCSDVEFSDALDSTEDSYVCTLDDVTAKKAQEELGEDPQTRLKQVNSLRQWLLDQKYVHANTDTPVLLMFLRAAKFRQEKARQKILGMLTLGRDRPSWFKDIDTTAEDILAVYNDLYVIPLPKPDKEGCTVVLYRMGSFDPSGARYTKSTIMKAFGALFIHLMKLEVNQVNGFVYVIDAADFNTRQQLFWTPNDLRTIARMWQIMLHGNDLDELRKHIPPEILPDEYLPEGYEGPSAGPMSHIVDNFKADLTSPNSKEYIKTMTSSKFNIKEENGHHPSRWDRIRHWVRFR